MVLMLSAEVKQFQIISVFEKGPKLMFIIENIFWTDFQHDK